MEFLKNDNPKQYELHLDDGAVAFVEYVSEADKVYLTHTEVPHSHRGHGVAQRLISRTLQHIRSESKTLVPLCSFVQWYVNNHDEWHSLLSDGYQM